LVLVVPHHHPLDIAKQYGTLDRICDGRLVLGLGVGYSEPEFALLGTPFDGRGDLADDLILALRASFGRVAPVYHGRFFDFEDFVVDPCGVQQDVPIWIGGMSRRSLRRAVELGDAWSPFAISTDDIKRWMAAARATEAWDRRSQPLMLVLTPDEPVDPLGRRAETLATVRALQDAGASKLTLRLAHESLEHYLEQLEAMVDALRDL
jgi:probable F420-dependent oxidoreductase